jgi:hypothetical protein
MRPGYVVPPSDLPAPGGSGRSQVGPSRRHQGRLAWGMWTRRPSPCPGRSLPYGTTLETRPRHKVSSPRAEWRGLPRRSSPTLAGCKYRATTRPRTRGTSVGDDAYRRGMGDRHLHAAGGAPSDTADLRVICLPSTDGTFAWAVRRALASGVVRSTGDLEAALRPHYPRVRVRARELSGEITRTWYAYRDRTFPYGES